MECRSLELIPPKKDGILSLQNFSSRVAKREKGKIVQNYFFFKKGLKKNWDHRNTAPWKIFKFCGGSHNF